MYSSRLALASLTALATLALSVIDASAATLCAAAHPNTTSTLESTPTSAFVLNLDGTVTHTLTGLMWKRCPQGMSASSCTGSAAQMNWKAALASATSDTTAGYADWRLPNDKELESIVESCGYTQSINLVVFPSTPNLQFWSSSTVPQTPAQAWTVDFNLGGSQPNDKTAAYGVRLVRSGLSPTAFDLRVGSVCNADIDGNGQIDALTDGLIFFRALFGLTGTAVTNGAIGVGAVRDDWPKVRAFMNAYCGTSLAP